MDNVDPECGMTRAQAACLALTIVLLVNMIGCSPADQSRLATQVVAGATGVAQASTQAGAVQTAVAQAAGTAAHLGTQVGEVQGTAVAAATSFATEVGSDPARRFQEWLGREAPEDLGHFSPDTDTTAVAADVKTAFDEVYKSVGGRVIGWPVGGVTVINDLLVQDLDGGSEEHSAIVMREDETTAYLISGEWLDTYQAAGGPEAAGYPISSKERYGRARWQLWHTGRGERQLFTLNGETYALLKASGSEVVNLVPPMFWDFYVDGDLVTKIGFPVSSYPLDDTNWEHIPGLSIEVQAMLEFWRDQPYRVLVFQEGSIVFNADRQSHEVVEKAVLSGSLGLGNLLLGAKRGFNDSYETLILTAASTECGLETMRHAKMAVGGEAADIVVREVAFLPLRATLAGVSVGVESLAAKVALEAAQYLLEMAASVDPAQDTVSALAGWLAEAVFSKSVGDFLTKPVAELAVSETTSALVEQTYAELGPDRVSRQVHLSPRPGGVLNVTLDTSVAINYDPLTRIASGVIVTDGCYPEGIAFQYRLDPATGYPIETASNAWPAGIQYLDLETGASFP